MKYIKKYQNQIFIDGRWVDIGIFDGESLVDDPDIEEDNFVVHTFEDLQKFADYFYGIDNNTRFFFPHRPYVRVRLGLSAHWNITEKYFQKHNELKFRKVYSSFNPTMEWLVKHLSADDFAQYAKDRGWNNIVIGE